MRIGTQAIRRILESAGYTVVVSRITDGAVTGRLTRGGKMRHEAVGASALDVLVELARKAGITGSHASGGNNDVVVEPNVKDGGPAASSARRRVFARLSGDTRKEGSL